MRTAPAAGAAAALLLLLTWFFLRGQADTRPHDRALEALEALEQFEYAESALQRDILGARAGLLRDYDPLVRDVQRLRDAAG